MAVDKQILRENGLYSELTLLGGTKELQDNQIGLSTDDKQLVHRIGSTTYHGLNSRDHGLTVGRLALVDSDGFNITDTDGVTFIDGTKMVLEKGAYIPDNEAINFGSTTVPEASMSYSTSRSALFVTTRAATGIEVYAGDDILIDGEPNVIVDLQLPLETVEDIWIEEDNYIRFGNYRTDSWGYMGLNSGLGALLVSTVVDSPSYDGSLQFTGNKEVIIGGPGATQSRITLDLDSGTVNINPNTANGTNILLEATGITIDAGQVLATIPPNDVDILGILDQSWSQDTSPSDSQVFHSMSRGAVDPSLIDNGYGIATRYILQEYNTTDMITAAETRVAWQAAQTTYRYAQYQIWTEDPDTSSLALIQSFDALTTDEDRFVNTYANLLIHGDRWLEATKIRPRGNTATLYIGGYYETTYVEVDDTAFVFTGDVKDDSGRFAAFSDGVASAGSPTAAGTVTAQIGTTSFELMYESAT